MSVLVWVKLLKMDKVKRTSMFLYRMLSRSRNNWRNSRDYRRSSTICVSLILLAWFKIGTCDISDCMPIFVWELGFNILKNVVDHLNLVICIKKSVGSEISTKHDVHMQCNLFQITISCWSGSGLKFSIVFCSAVISPTCYYTDFYYLLRILTTLHSLSDVS